MQRVVDHTHSAAGVEMVPSEEMGDAGQQAHEAASTDVQFAHRSPVKDAVAVQAVHENGRRTTSGDWHSVVEVQKEVQTVNGSGWESRIRYRISVAEQSAQTPLKRPRRQSHFFPFLQWNLSFALGVALAGGTVDHVGA
jgi:hypothetical protein